MNPHSTPIKPYHAIILAADRGPNDPVATATNMPCKALAPIAGTPMLIRVVDALEATRTVEKLTLSGPAAQHLQYAPELDTRVKTGKLAWRPPESGPSASVATALGDISPAAPVLVTTADHALLSSEMVDYFLAEAERSGCDALVALAPYTIIKAAYPDTKRTITRFKDGGYCGCNLFALTSPRARSAVAHWRRIEQQRKKPFRVIGLIGWPAILRYLIGRLTLGQALARLSKRMHMKVGAVIMPFADAAVDVDTPADLELVNTILQQRDQQTR